MYELIITEKPKASQKIAEALADGKAIKENKNGVPIYKVTHGKKDIVVGCAVGHLFTLAQKKGKSFQFPVFDVEWKPTSEVSKSAAFSKKYITALKSLVKGAKEFTVATDFDIEGEVIGLNVIKYICNQKDANRMKFSTLTKPDLVKAYETKFNTLNWGQANAGTTRHELDWYYGINLSRALTHSIKTTGAFKILSIGRVQGPALNIVVKREKEIKAFISTPYWQLEMLGKINSHDIDAWHEKDKFQDKKEAENIFNKTKGKPAKVKEVTKKEFNQMPPFPFDLTSLQIEAYKVFKIDPKNTLAIAQDLYIAGLISYPRTSSQKLPPAIGYQKILEELGQNPNYKELTKILLAKKNLKPNEGAKTDEAHPALYPTGINPKELEDRKKKIYDLITRRFMATFGDPAKRESNSIKIECNNEIFITKGIRTIEKGWHQFYEPYLRLEEQELPKVAEGQEVNVKEIKLHAKETLPPKRYTPASIIKDLEKKNLGTKATRAQIVETLFQRGYVEGDPLTATELGIHTIETLEKYSPEIIDEELTRHFEDELDDIRKQTKKQQEVLDEAKEFLIKILKNFKKNESEIGKGLLEANRESQTKSATVGRCPNCETGTLLLRRGKFGKFVACDKYPECKTTFKMPSNGMIKTSENLCVECKHPMIMVIKKAKRPQEICINRDCPSKKILDEKMQKEAEKIENGKIEKKCPKCNEGNLVLRKSIYGQFYGCSKYPKCRFIQKINGQNNNQNKPETDKNKL